MDTRIVSSQKCLRPSLGVHAWAVGAALAVVLVAASSAAAGAPLEVTVDRNSVQIGERFQLTVTIEGDQLATPQLPQLPDFAVNAAGTTRTMSIVNGAATSNVGFNYLLTPRKPGTYTIGEVTVEIDGKPYQSRPFQVRVVPAGTREEGNDDADVFVTAKVTDESPFVGEQVIYTLRFYRRVRITDARAELPDFEGFLVEELGEQREYTTVMQGQEYTVTELRRALFPQEQGSIVIPAARLTVTVVPQARRRSGWFFDPFSGGGSMESRVVSSAPARLEVRALPAEPPGYSGLVGEFSVTAAISKSDLKVGESTTLTVTVRGTGNVRSIPEPAIAGLDAFKVYSDKPQSTVENGGEQVAGTKTFRRSLVPMREGTLRIPPTSMVYFDPKQGSYQTARSRPLELHVAQAESPEELRLTEVVGAEGGKVAVHVIADDIRPIYTNLDALDEQGLHTTAGAGWGTAFVTPPLLFVALGITRRRREREASDHNLLRRRTALRKGLKGVGEIRAAGRGDAAPAEASRVLRSFIGDALGVEGLALTPKDAAHHLGEAGVDPEMVAEIRSLLERCEAAQYGAGRGHDLEATALAQSLTRLMTQLDKCLPRGRAGERTGERAA